MITNIVIFKKEKKKTNIVLNYSEFDSHNVLNFAMSVFRELK
jgi:hypothetical protein